LTRRGFVRLGASAAALAPLAGIGSPGEARAADTGRGSDPWQGLKVGIATYTLNKFPMETAIQYVKRVGLHYVSIKDVHLPLKSSASERKAVAQKFLDAGITPMSCGNITMSDDESEIRNVFEYARDAGIPTIVCKPTAKSLPILDKMVKEYDIKLAIHNHGPEDNVWPSPLVAWEAVQSFDPRIGLCIDVGHTARTGVDPSDAIRRCAARLYDLHIKDIAVASGKSQPVELGRGVLDIPEILKSLLKIKYPYLVGLEYEKDMKDPLAGVAESIGYIKGVLVGMRNA
jgi:sugar phosphate isomerase/epimerase